MNMEEIMKWVDAALEIVARHAADGDTVTDEEIKQELLDQVGSGQHTINQWYAAHGLELPK